MNEADFDENGNRFGVFIRHTERKVYLVAIGEPLLDWRMQGYTDGSCEVFSEDVTGTVRVFKCTLGEVVLDCAAEYSVEESLLFTKTVGAQLDRILSLQSEQLSDYNEWLRLDDILQNTLGQDRIFWLETEIKIPAGESVQVNAESIQRASFGYGVSGRTGFAVAVHAESTLEFDEVKAEVHLQKGQTLVSSSMDFLQDKNNYTAVLDPKQVQYSFEVYS